MKASEDIYNQLEEQVKRLSGEQKLLTIQEVLQDFVIPVTPEQQKWVTELLETKQPEYRQKLLDKIKATREAIKILALMEASDNLEDFKDLANKKYKRNKKESKPELDDFGEFIKGVLNVPKPTKEQMKEYLEKNSKKHKK